MSKGRINSDESIATAARALRAAGDSWVALERAAHRDAEGVYVVRASDLAARRATARH